MAELGRSGELCWSGIGLDMSSNLISIQLSPDINALQRRDEGAARSGSTHVDSRTDTVCSASTEQPLLALVIKIATLTAVLMDESWRGDK